MTEDTSSGCRIELLSASTRHFSAAALQSCSHFAAGCPSHTAGQSTSGYRPDSLRNAQMGACTCDNIDAGQYYLRANQFCQSQATRRMIIFYPPPSHLYSCRARHVLHLHSYAHSQYDSPDSPLKSLGSTRLQACAGFAVAPSATTIAKSAIGAMPPVSGRQ